MFKEFFAKLGLAPKSLDQASATQAEAKSFAEAVGAQVANIGGDLDTIMSAGAEGLKTYVAKLTSDAVAAATADYEGRLTAAVAEKDAATKAQEFAQTQNEALLKALSDVGIKTVEGNKFAEAIESRISARAREIVASIGGPLIDDKVAADATNAKGNGRVECTLAEFNAKSPAEKMAFSKSGGRITG